MAISLYELSQRISSSMPLGTIVPYYGTDEPSGWKICDGRSCAGTELAKKLGISNVPDLRGRFIRMIGGNAAGMAVAQEDCIRNITGTIHFTTQRGASLGGAFQTYSGLGGTTYNGGNNGGYHPDWKFDASRVVPTGPENRPINMAFNYIIKVGTNVILYYVSNIIYKAIAIIKSLLSKAKEEVRRTLAISLNNHEDRIKVLESRIDGSVCMKLLFAGTLYEGQSGTITLTDNIGDYNIVLVGHGNDSWGHTSMFIIDGDNTLIQTLGGRVSEKWKYVWHDTDQYGLSICSDDFNSKQVRLTFGGNYFLPLRYIYGIKIPKAILYSFSYIIIYRLTQILFNSPFFWN